jgi:conjugative relaxase-like TrwC/TraI family protein
VLAIIPTRNLLMALIEHDTSRELDPHAHIHTIIMNATRTFDGEWRALDNRALWRANSSLGEMHAHLLMAATNKLGYRVLPSGHHGTFTITDVPRAVMKLSRFAARNSYLARPNLHI